LLSTDWVNKINLYEFIDAYKENRNLRAVNNVE
jgi:hypothetical protein